MTIFTATDPIRWDRIDDDSELSRVLKPWRDHFDPDDENFDEYDTVLDGHLMANGHVQLFNPGFDDHLLGVGTVPWFGFGECALLAWHLHLRTGWDLVTLMPGVTAPMVHTAVVRPDGAICDWRGVHTEPGSAVEGYREFLYPPSSTEPHRPTWRWQVQSPDEWTERWLHFRPTEWIELGGHAAQQFVAGKWHKASSYDEFEIALADWLAGRIAAVAGHDGSRPS